jgi:Tfp pilus assembly protein PilX
MRRWRGLRLVREERGLALIMAIGMTTVLAIAGTTAVAYSTSSSKQSVQSGSRLSAFTLAEAGINNVMSILNLPTNNALDPDILPSKTSCSTNLASTCSSPYGDGYVVWGGTLDRSTAVWTVTSTGYRRNTARGSAGYVSKTLTAKVSVTPTLTQPLNNPSWNYMFATRTGNTCDETLNNNVGGGSRMYVAGNLCISNNANLAPSALVVLGNLDVDNNASVGANTSMATRTETYVGGWCSYGKGTTANPCTGNQDANNIFSKKNPPNYVVGVNNVPTLLTAPTTDFPGWYENSIPGPSQSCTTSSGTPPVFDTNYPTRDNSVTTPFDLTPASSYTCRVGPAGNPSGELSWNATTKMLTVSGTIFIDGSAKVTNSAATYNGQAALYLSGTFLVSGKLCGAYSGANCDAAGWDPNTEMLTVVTGSTGGQVTAGDGVQLANGAAFQGALYSSGNIEMGNNAITDGPMVGAQIILSNNVTTSSFGTVTTVPVGQPGNPEVYAQPNPPQMFSG